MLSSAKTVWLRKRQVRERYGQVSDRTVDRWVRAGRLPAPQYPVRNAIPMWIEAELDESDAAAAAAYRALATA
jgi:hypothetical protein